MTKIPITIGVAAYNEEQNIKKFLESLLIQKLIKIIISQIVIVSSGSTDKTNEIVASFVSRYPFIKLIKQKKRLGKAAAVNVIIKNAKEDLIILSSADLLIKKDSIEKLTIPFKDEKVGIVGCHPIPLNKKDTFFGFSAHMLWELHHIRSLKFPKMGECIAFRKVFKRIPVSSAVDEANIESIIKKKSYKAVYAYDAVVYNKGAENLRDFIKQRRRIYAGHLATKHEHNYQVSTISGTKIFFLLMQNFTILRYPILWASAVMLLEIYSRFLGFVDYKTNYQHAIWQRIESTKKL